MRIETFVDDGLNTAVLAHLHDVDAPGIGTGKHPVLFLKLGDHAFDCTPGAEWFAASDTKEGILFFQDSRWRVPRLKIQLWTERDGVFRAGCFAQTALHADALGEAQHRPIGVIRERAGRACGYAGMAERAAFHIEQHRAEWRTGRERYNIHGRRRREMQFSKRSF